MSDYISREAAIERAEYDGNYRLVVAVEAIKGLPAADVVPAVHGRWIEYPVAHYFKCSNCKYTVPYKKAALLNGKRSYTCCPHCHAVMDLEETNELDKREG